MNIKRALFALMALMLLPATALAQLEVTPAEGTANIIVQLGFTDGNQETPVDITLSCTTGDYSPDFIVAAPVRLLTPGAEKVFVISNIPPDFDGNVCTVKQAPIDGYYNRAVCFGEPDVEPNEDCRIFEAPAAPLDAPEQLGEGDDWATYCQFDDINDGEVARCIIATSPSPVKVKVTKEWDVSGFGGKNYNRNADFYVACDGYIVEGKNDDVDRFGNCNMSGFRLFRCSSEQYFSLNDNDGDYEDKDGVDTGMATVTVNVIPEWYPTVKKPTAEDPQLATTCKAYEPDVDSAVEVDASDCAKMPVSVSNGNSCTIVNTLFFEGIPTLNQYGMAIMALLMLSVGFVGFRRFV